MCMILGVEEEFTVVEDRYLAGLGDTYTVYAKVPFSVCKHMCVELHSDSCCSLVYFEGLSECFITPLEANITGVTLEYKPGASVARRKQCECGYC